MNIPRWRPKRVDVFAAVGLLGIIYETVKPGGADAALLVTFVGLLGFPAVVRSDLARKTEAQQTAPPPAEPAPPAKVTP